MTRLPRSFAFLFVAISCAMFAAPIAAQVTQTGGGWKASSANGTRYNGSDAPAKSGATAAPARPAGEITPVPGGAAPIPGITRAQVTKGSGALPQDHGQVWREYDIRPYTQRVNTTARPEQAIVDWILRETGYEAWHSDPVGLLSANHDVLRVYHTPEMQSVVADITDRFVNSAASAYAFTLRVATVGNPNWRAKPLTMTAPISVQSPGGQ